MKDCFVAFGKALMRVMYVIGVITFALSLIGFTIFACVGAAAMFGQEIMLAGLAALLGTLVVTALLAETYSVYAAAREEQSEGKDCSHCSGTGKEPKKDEDEGPKKDEP